MDKPIDRYSVQLGIYLATTAESFTTLHVTVINQNSLQIQSEMNHLPTASSLMSNTTQHQEQNLSRWLCLLASQNIKSQDRLYTSMYSLTVGASICLANFNNISQMNLSPSNLLPCSKKVTVVGESTINCTRWLPIQFSINGNSSRQPVFVCDEVDRIYVGRQACIDLHILPPCYPHPMPPTPKSDEAHRIEGELAPALYFSIMNRVSVVSLDLSTIDNNSLIAIIKSLLTHVNVLTTLPIHQTVRFKFFF